MSTSSRMPTNVAIVPSNRPDEPDQILIFAPVILCRIGSSHFENYIIKLGKVKKRTTRNVCFCVLSFFVRFG